MDTLLVFLIQMALILVATRCGSHVATRLHVAPVLGEIVAGIALGPTVFGLLLPRLQLTLFPGPGSVPDEMLQSMSWMGLILLMFIGGLDVDTGLLRRNLRCALLIASGALACTMALGVGVAGVLPLELLPEQGHTASRIFVALALAITAIPVLIKILLDLGLLSTPFGATIIVAGVVADTVGWILLGMLARATTVGYSLHQTLTSLGLVAVFLLCTFTLGHLFFIRLVKLQRRRDDLSVNFLAAVMVLMLIGASVTHTLGLHPVLGAFAIGLMVGRWRLSESIKHKLEGFAFAFFVPVFLANLGLRANLLLLSSWKAWGTVLLLTGASSLSMLVGGAVGARLGGLGTWESLGAGVGLITNGAMGLVAARLGHDLGLIPSTMYSALVVVAVARTLLAAVGLQLLRSRLAADQAEARRDP